MAEIERAFRQHPFAISEEKHPGQIGPGKIKAVDYSTGHGPSDGASGAQQGAPLSSMMA